jgi:hypothetical protein
MASNARAELKRWAARLESAVAPEAIKAGQAVLRSGLKAGLPGTVARLVNATPVRRKPRHVTGGVAMRIARPGRFYPAVLAVRRQYEAAAIRAMLEKLGGR